VTAQTWRIRAMHGGSGTLTHPVIAVAPGCPDERHPTRGCRCKVFRSRALAETWIAEQDGEVEP